eukprot:maker-scaffold76_size406464-snap-gene-1.11 protein:Tk10230 transcript:maker-scaffold76_size406464-snap-gene-1.11-mRNA-1 annotation:"hypothetical protein"
MNTFPGLFFLLICALSPYSSGAHYQSHPGHQGSRPTTTEDGPVQFPTDGDIIDVALGGSNLNTLVFAIKTAELVDTLKAGGPYTIFAPSDRAFAKIEPKTLEALIGDKEILTNTLFRHVIDGQMLMAADFPMGPSVQVTLGGEFVSTMNMGGNVTITSSIAEARVIQGDVKASN